jgi:hypothetical protein
VAVDGDERTPGPRWRFAVGAPAAPGGPSVPDGAPLDAPPNTLSWAATPGARDYQLYVDGQRALRTASTVATIDEPLAGGPHTWAVVARNAIGATSGPTWTFATPAPPFAQSSQPFSGTLVYCDPVAVDGKVVFTTTPSLSPNEVWNGVPVLNVFDPVTGSLAASDFPGGLDTYGLGSTFLANPALRPPAVVGARVLFYDSTVVDVYDLSTRQWSTHPLSVARTAMAIAVVGDQVVFAGGDGKRGGGGAVDIYHADTDQWSTARLSAPRDGIAVAIVGGKLVLAGGYDDAELKPSDAFDVYDPASGQWTAGRLAVPHDVSAVAVVGNSALFAGGFSAPRKGGRTRPTDAVEVYDAGSGQWSIAHLSSPGSDITALAVGHFALFAGQPRADWTQPAAVDLYDAQRGTWSAAQLSPPSLAFAGETGAATVGDRALFTHDGVADVFDASTGQWSSRPLPGFVDESASNEPPDIGQVRVVGHVALIGGGQALHVYDADADRWSVVRLEGEGINLYTGVVVGTRAVYLTRAGKYGNPVIGTPRLDVLTLLPEQGNQP